MSEPVILEDLPAELRHTILCFLPDVPSLIALVHASPKFYQSFIASTSLITASVIFNQITPAVLPEAIATWQSSLIQPRKRSRERVREFLRHYTPNGDTRFSPSTLPSWTLLEALAISELHTHVEFFTENFATSILPVYPISGTHCDVYAPPSLLERSRMQRTFYRHELFCNLFRQHALQRHPAARFTPLEQGDWFFKKFTPWENEQLACVRDYLYQQISLPFNEVAEHDVLWGRIQVGVLPTLISQRTSSNMEHYLSLGLDFLHRLVLADTYDRRYALLTPLREDYQFLSVGLLTGIDDNIGSPTLYEHEQKSLRIDGDPGPRQVWSWAYANNHHGPFYFAKDKADLREWGYCMWDLERLAAWGVFWKPWAPDRAYKKRFRQYLEQQAYREKMQKSWEERSKIYERHGRGWWSEGDESRIFWRYAR